MWLLFTTAGSLLADVKSYITQWDERQRLIAAADRWQHPVHSFWPLAWARTLERLTHAGTLISAWLRSRLLRWHTHALQECPFCHIPMEYSDIAHLRSCPQFFGARRRAQSSVLAPLKSLLGASMVEWRPDTLVDKPG